MTDFSYKFVERLFKFSYKMLLILKNTRAQLIEWHVVKPGLDLFVKH
jgi:hypothetical protein